MDEQYVSYSELDAVTNFEFVKKLDELGIITNPPPPPKPKIPEDLYAFANPEYDVPYVEGRLQNG